MVKALCPDCHELHEITPTGQKQGSTGSSEWWRLVMHKDPKETRVCEGSGKKV